MGRPETDLDPGLGPVQRFAFELRKLRQEAGGITYRQMARQVEVSVATLSRAAKGEQLPSLPVALAYVRACGGDEQAWERRWREAVTEQARAADLVADETVPSPYRGLARFEVGDAPLFFGRDEVTDTLVRTVTGHRVVVVFGPSGSGKSSLLRAGLIPRLRGLEGPQRPAAVRILTPGEHPLRTLDTVCAPAPGEGDTWLVVDQFEEVFTLCHDAAERAEFIAHLLAARHPENRLRVILGVRADFYSRCLDQPGLDAIIQEASLPVGRMTPSELREVIVKPAAAEGLIVERALTAHLIEEVREEPGALPLLSHVLLETWRRRRGRTLTMAAYEAAGGLHGAIAQTAETFYTRLPDAQAVTARRILLRLITPGDGNPDTRRPIDVSELGEDQRTDTRTVLDLLARARLIILEDTVVELGHEALITAWPRLHGWIEEDRERLRAHRRLTEATRAWAELDRDPGALYRGTRLSTAEEHLCAPGHRDELTATEQAFLNVSIAARHEEQLASTRRNRYIRYLAFSLAVLLVVVTGISLLAISQRRDADRARIRATSRQLAAQAMQLVHYRPGAAMQLSVEAYRLAPTAEARSALLSMSARQYYQGRLAGHGDAVSDAAFSPDGTLATVSRDRSVALWDPTRRQRTARLTSHDTWLRAVAFSRNGRLLATGGDDRKVVLWDAASGKRSATLSGAAGAVKSIAFSADSRTVAGAGDGRTVTVWSIAHPTVRRTLAGHTGTVNAMAFSPDGRTLVTASEDHTVRWWDVAAGRRLAVQTGHTQSVDDVAFSPDGRTLATASRDHTVRLWDARRHIPKTTLTGHTGQVRTVAFSPDGQSLASAGHDETVMLWDAERGTLRATLTGHNNNIYTLAFNPRGSLLASAGEDGTITLWNPRRTPLRAHTDRLNKVAFSPDGRTLATASDDTTAVLWNTDRGTRRTTLRDGASPVNSAAFSPDGRTLAAATGIPQKHRADNNLTLWDLTGKPSAERLTRDTDRVTDVAYSPDGRTVAGVTAEGTVMLWDPRRRTRLANLIENTQTNTISTNAVAFSPDGRLLATASHDQKVRIWDLARRTRTATLTGHTASLRSVAFSPDGRTLASTGEDQTIMLWDIASHRRRAVLKGHTGSVNAVAFSPDGRLLATAGADRTAMLWDTRRRIPIATLTGHTGPVRSVAFSPDGRTLATASTDHTAMLWNTDLQRTAVQLCNILAASQAPRTAAAHSPTRHTCDTTVPAS
ncbi:MULTISPECIES: helix-turn-helix domain-containing protein [unclassified Streptomyces]|uniref:nSTAND1 domain-containing NTPase n=1 Tax=unclassified Streptomyces TaxID=2593676 RepID=UPI0036E73E3B